MDFIDPVSPLSLLIPSMPVSAEADARGLSEFFSDSPLLLILLLMVDRMDLEVESFVSDLLMIGSDSVARLVEDAVFVGVRVPSLPFDCCWPI